MKYLQINDEGYTPCGKWRVVPVDADSVIISRTLTPEAWKRLCNADIWPVTPKSFQRMLNVLADVAAISAAPTPPAELMLSGEPVCGMSVIDEGESWPVFYREKEQILWQLPIGDYKLYLHPAHNAATVRDAERLREAIEQLREWVRTEGDHNGEIGVARGVR